ncbi:MAG TPA: type II secretion system ATPase GspE [Planctomycetota bacterium]|nr:type II secretion system ATPase GspE [Planctomycetota bacterium]
MRELIREFIRKHELLDPERLEEVFRLEEESGQTFERIMLHKGYMSENDLLRTLAHALEIPYLPSLSDQLVPDDFVGNVPVGFARNYALVGVGRENGAMRVATAFPLDTHPMDDLASMIQCEIEPVLAPRAEITSLINRAYKNKAGGLVDETMEGLREDDILKEAAAIDESEDLLATANKAPIIRLVNMVLFNALKMRASDVHFQPFPDRLQVRYRIDGVLYDMEAPPKKVQDAILSRLKVQGGMDIAERRMPQDGRATVKIGDADVDIRISAVPTNYGERIVLRLLDKSARLYSLEEIGLESDNLRMVEHYIQYQHGIILVTGPTGSGKSTTLYAALQKVNSSQENVITLEDPIEYHIAGISQIQINEKKGLTFAKGLRHLLRQDPDIMMVGEIRDVETARIAIQAALTGHLVYSTLHTNDAASTVTRLVDIGIEPYLVASSVICVIAQRLVRRICPSCREEHEPTPEELRDLKLIGLKIEDFPSGRLFHGRGCPSCFNTGYTDRTGIYEIMPVDDTLKDQIIDRKSSSVIKKSAIERGCRTLRMDGAQKVLSGVTTPAEVLRVTQLDSF